MIKIKIFLLKLLIIIISVVIWLPCMHFFYKPDINEYRSCMGIPPKAEMMLARQLEIWTNPELRKIELDKMQSRNPEWDFMSRTYLVLSLANVALRDESYKQQACDIIDTIIDNTLRIEREKRMFHFLLEYGHTSSWVLKPARSQFVDGEIALMLAARRMVEEKASYKVLLAERVKKMIDRMRKSPVLCAESYPDECWIFCNTISLAAIRMADVLDGRDHSEFLSSWIETAKQKLIDPQTGIMISAFDINGKPVPSGFAPEGSSIWMATHMLEIVDEKFAADQYHLAKSELADSILGFGYSREWPLSLEGNMDIDSGPVVPYLGASASASGLALIAAAGFDDPDYFTSLMTSLDFAAFPLEKDGMLRYQAGNPVGNSVVLYAMVEGPLWAEIQRRSKNE